MADFEPVICLCRDQVNLAPKRRRIGPDGLFALHHGRMASAIPAQSLAEGDVEVEGQRAIRVVWSAEPLDDGLLAEIVPEVGQREFPCLDGAADRCAALENSYFPAFRRQMRGACQTVVACPDEYGVKPAHVPPNPFPLCLKIIADAYVFV